MTHATPGEIIHLPLSKLIQSKLNPRKSDMKDADPVLVASIRSRGLLQNLGVQPSAQNAGKYEVRFGGRRLKALRALAKEGHFDKNETFPCRVVGDADADEEALAENVVRKEMNPADEMEAWAKLSDDGLSVEDIAARFGVTERQVRARLALGGAATCVREALRKEEISLDTAKIFAGCPDLARQERVFASVCTHGRFTDYTVKRALYEHALSQSDDLVRFVGLDAYEQAGGAVERDLLSEETHLTDIELLGRLRDERLEARAAELRDQGWSWVECHERYDWQTMNGMDRLYGEPVETSDEDAARIAELEAKLETFEAMDDEAFDEDADAACAEVEEELAELRRVEYAFTDAQKSVAGCVIYPSGEGITVYDGLVRKEDKRKAKALLDPSAEDTPPVERQIYSRSLADDLQVYRAQAVQAALVRDPVTAVTLAHFVVVRAVLAHQGGLDTTIDGGVCELGVKKGELGDTLSAKVLTDAEQHLPIAAIQSSSAADAWQAFMALSEGEREDLVAYAVARALRPSLHEDGLPGALGATMGVDLRSYWTPTGDVFFSRLRKDQLEGFIVEMAEEKQASYLMEKGAKKDDLVRFCERMISGNCVLPEEAKTRLAMWVPEGMGFEMRQSAPAPGGEGEASEEGAGDAPLEVDAA